MEEVSLDGPELEELLGLPELPLELLLSSLEESSDEPVLESELPESGVLLELVAVFFVFLEELFWKSSQLRYRIHGAASVGSERCRLPSRRVCVTL